MKQKLILFFFSLLIFGIGAKSQDVNDLINVLVKRGSLTQKEADSLRTADVLKQQANKSKDQQFPIQAGRILQLSGYTQLRFQSFQKSGVPEGFDVRKARLIVSGSLDSKFDYYLQSDFAGAAVTLVDAYVDYKPFKFLKVTAGQFIIPFSIENIVPDRLNETIDRSQVVNSLVARKGDASNGLIDSVGNQLGRDIGVELSSSLIQIQQRKLLDLSVALLNGNGINTTENNIYKDVAARLVLHPFSFLNIGASYYDGNDKYLNGYAGTRTRWGTELTFKYKRINLQTEFIKGQDANKAKGHVTHQGEYVQLSYFVLPEKLQGVLKYDYYDPNTAIKGVDATYYIFGLNYYFSKWVKLQVDYRQTTDVAKNLFSTQLQLSF